MPDWVLIVVTVISINDGTRHLEMKWFNSLAQCGKAKVERLDTSEDVVFIKCAKSENLPI